MTVPVIFEDQNILVIDKPSGVVVHPFDFSQEETLLDFLLEKIPESFQIDNSITLQDNRAINLGGIVHKLDRDTSGVMVIAKNEKTHEELREQFARHTIKKKYMAIVEGIISEDEMIIDAPLGRNKKDYKQVVNPENPRGELRDAVTDLYVLKRSKGSTLIELAPKTGRTHQLRAHMSYIKHPILGDKAYGSTHESDRIMLHASSITISVSGCLHTFISDAPESFCGEHEHTHTCK